VFVHLYTEIDEYGYRIFENYEIRESTGSKHVFRSFVG